MLKVTMLMAVTADGMIGKNAQDFPDWTGREDKRMFREITLKAGVLIIGSRTFDTIGRPLPGRKNVVLTRNPERISQTPDLVFTDREPRRILADLEDEGYHHAVLAGGSIVNYLFASQGLIDEMYITYVPKIFGAGVPLFAGQVSLELELISQKTLGEGRISVRYRVVDSARR